MCFRTAVDWKIFTQKQVKIDDSTTEITNVVYARDPSVIDAATGTLN